MTNATVQCSRLRSASRFMKRASSCVAAALCAIGTMGAGPVHATLVGDTVTVGHYSPDTTSPPSGATPPDSFMVVAGSADLYTFYHSYPYGYQVNVEANSIFVDFNYLFGATATWADSVTNIEWTCTAYSGIYCSEYTQTSTTVPYSFNGLVASDLNDSSGNALQGVLVDTNMAGWDSSRLSFGGDYVQFDWKGLSFTSNIWNADQTSIITPATYFNATLDFGGTTAPVPEPEIYAMLGLGLGLMGWVGRRRKQQAA
jgi:PEP-CTERM motif